MRKIELLSPAGDMERLKLAVKFGADAVYVGGTMFGMRTNPSNFDADQLKEAVSFVHKNNKKIYLTCNTLPRNNEIEFLPDYLKYVSEIGVDALIIADMGVLSLAKNMRLILKFIFQLRRVLLIIRQQMHFMKWVQSVL